MSLVEGQRRGRHAAQLGRFAAAFATSSFTVFALAGLFGLAAAHVLTSHARLAIACAVFSVALLLDAYSVRHRTWCPVTMHRETPRNIQLRSGARRTAVAWGVDTGLVFTTYRMTSISWALLALTVTGYAPWWIGIGYAAGFLVPVLLGTSVLRLRADRSDGTGLAVTLARYPQAARVACFAALAAAVGLTASALVS